MTGDGRENVVFGFELAANEFTDVLWFNQIGVSHNTNARANYGHTYLTGSVAGNVFRWSERFLIDSIWQEPGQADRVLPGLEFGEGETWDDTEFRVGFGTNFIDLPAGWLNRRRSGFAAGRSTASRQVRIADADARATACGPGPGWRWRMTPARVRQTP